MLSGAIGIASSAATLGVGFRRRTTTITASLTPGMPIAEYNWTVGGLSYSGDGQVFFDLIISGNTTSVTQYGILNSNLPNPVYPDGRLITEPDLGISYSISDKVETSYYRAYSNRDGEYVYSSPDIEFRMETINFTQITVTIPEPVGSPNDISIVLNARLLSHGRTLVIDYGGFVINRSCGDFSESTHDPYWGFGETYVAEVKGSGESNYDLEFTYLYTDTCGTNESYMWIRAFVSIDGVEYWSNLVNFTTADLLP